MTVSQTIDGYALASDEGEAIWFNGGLCIVKASGPETNGRLAAVEFRVPAGFAAPLHVHHHDDEIFLVLSGDVRFRLGEDVVEASAGSLVYGPREIGHSFTVDTEARLLLLFAPAGTEMFFREAGKPARWLGQPPADEPLIDRETLIKLAAGHGQDIIGPPLGPKS